MPGCLIPQLGELLLPRNGDGVISCSTPGPKPSDQLNTKDWEEDPDNYSKLEEGLTAMKAELAKFKD